MGVSKPPSTNPSSPDSSLPGICKDLIGQTVAQLRGCDSREESVADRLTYDLFFVHSAVRAISSLYNLLDDDSQENSKLSLRNVLSCRFSHSCKCTLMTDVVEENSVVYIVET